RLSLSLLSFVIFPPNPLAALGIFNPAFFEHFEQTAIYSVEQILRRLGLALSFATHPCDCISPAECLACYAFGAPGPQPSFYFGCYGGCVMRERFRLRVRDRGCYFHVAAIDDFAASVQADPNGHEPEAY